MLIYLNLPISPKHVNIKCEKITCCFCYISKEIIVFKNTTIHGNNIKNQGLHQKLSNTINSNGLGITDKQIFTFALHYQVLIYETITLM